MPFPTPPALIETPSGEYALPLVRASQLLASCAEVQAMFGVANAPDAFDMIDYPLRDVESFGPPQPGVVVQGWKQFAKWDGTQQGEVLISLWDVVKEEYQATEDAPLDFKNDALAWLNRCGAIRGQMKALSKTPLADFGGVLWNAIEWRDHVYPGHDYEMLGEGEPALWFRFSAFTVTWIL